MLTYAAVDLADLGSIAGSNLAQAESKSEGGAAEHTAPKRGDARRRPKKKEAAKKTAKGEKSSEKTSAEPVIGSGGEYSSNDFDEELVKTSTLDAVLLLDSSGSMQRTDPQRLKDQGAKLFLRFLAAGDRVAIMQFDSETTQLADFTPIDPNQLATLDGVIDSVKNEGRFTDLESPIAAAFKLLAEKGRSDAVKCVILLSDGKMDPQPSRGAPEALVEQMLNQDLAGYREKGIKLYTLSFSEESDRELLAKAAQATDGLNWYAPDGNTIHIKFSELFLTLKKPQLASIESGGFEIDGGVHEATFYITRPEPEKQVSLKDPTGKEITNFAFPPNVKWFKGELFDVVTITKPLPGRWQVAGLENPEGFATLLTDIKLQVRWPETNLKVGDKVQFMARLTSSGKPFEVEGLDNVIFYNFKIVSGAAGGVVSSGSLRDDGQGGDEKAADDIFTGVAKIEEGGEYKALITVTAPTFTRQQQVPFNVSTGLISLSLVPPDEFEKKPESLLITLSTEGTRLKKPKVQIVAKNTAEETEEGIILAATPLEGHPGSYAANPTRLPAGSYKLVATISGHDSKGKLEQGASESVDYTSQGATEEGETAEVATEEGESGVGADTIVGIIFLILSAAWAGGLNFFILRRFSFSKSIPEERKPYSIPPELEAKISNITARSSAVRREPSANDVRIFSLVSAAYPAEVVAKAQALAADKLPKTNSEPDATAEDSASPDLESEPEQVAEEGKGANAEEASEATDEAEEGDKGEAEEGPEADSNEPGEES